MPKMLKDLSKQPAYEEKGRPPLQRPNGEKVFTQKVQEYYSLRCIPQVLGPIVGHHPNAEMWYSNEINSVNDNPIIDQREQERLPWRKFPRRLCRAGNGKLKIAITKLSMLAERQLNYLMNDKLNQSCRRSSTLANWGSTWACRGCSSRPLNGG